jgi:hypothetical protein
MGKTLSAIRQIIRQMLRDEFVSGEEYDFNDDELDLHIQNVLVEISQKRPYQVKETLTGAGSKELDISTIENLLNDGIEKAEYPVDNSPPKFCSGTVFGDTFRLDDNSDTPSTGASVCLYCLKVHQLTESSSTLKADLEKVLIEGATANTALAWVNQLRKDLVNARDTITSADTAIGEMDARITQSISDLASGRSLINKVNVGGSPENDWALYATRELSNATASLNKANGYFHKLTEELNIGAAITRYQNWANNQLMLYQRNLKSLSKMNKRIFY